MRSHTHPILALSPLRSLLWSFYSLFCVVAVAAGVCVGCGRVFCVFHASAVVIQAIAQ